MDPVNLLLVILLTPLFAAGLIWVFGRQAGGIAAAISVAAAAIIAAGSLYLLYALWNGQAIIAKTNWLELGTLSIDLGIYLTPLSALMLFVVGFVGFLIHVFSIGYMKDDAEKGRFFGGLSIFMFSMLGIVLAENLFMIFIFWELVGFSSYMLIGHYLKKQEAADASKKAFIVNRVGDFGFLIGIVITYWTFGTTSLIELEILAGANSGLVTTLLGLLLFCGVLGKSAQMPLHVWLPDAMAGPTPISALIHAATMVAAGVFFLGRTWFLFTPDALEVITWVGTITAVSAAIWAFAQSDIKKILAYSTLSQLGYMVAAFGLGTAYGLSQGDGTSAALYGVGASMFHLTTHAFFKALLFLGSGSVIHACHHEQDIFKMGGLYKSMPLTTLTFLSGVIAIAGIPYIAAGFFSKDAILFLAMKENSFVFYILTGTALLTAMYMGRLFFVAFLGTAKSDHAAHAHESSWTMVGPLVILMIFAFGGGYLFLYPETIQNFFNTHVPHPKGADHQLLVIISAVASIVGLALGYIIYGAGAKTDRLESKSYPLFAFSKSRFYFDEVYNTYVSKVQDRFANILEFLDNLLIAGIGMRGTAGVAGVFGIIFRSLHTGRVSGYVWWFFFGTALFWGYATGIFESIF